jgi:hypothetical protein
MGDDVTSALLQSVHMSVTRVPFTPRPTTATVAPATTPTVAAAAAEPAAESESLLRTLGDSFIGRAMLGAAGAMAVLSPMVKPIVVAYAQAPARLAPDQRTTVNFLQVRAEVQLRERLLSGSGRVTVDEVAVITSAVDKGTVAPQRMLQLAHELIAKRGFNGDALAKITDFFSAKQATMAAPLREHAAAQAVAVTGVLAKDSVAYTDVKQGAVGDCYFAASAAAIVARDPSFPHRIIEERRPLLLGAAQPQPHAFAAGQRACRRAGLGVGHRQGRSPVRQEHRRPLVSGARASGRQARRQLREARVGLRLRSVVASDGLTGRLRVAHSGLAA